MDRNIGELWEGMAKLAFKINIHPDGAEANIQCSLCGFITNLDQESLKQSGFEKLISLRVSLMIQHMRVCHRYTYLNMMERVYNAVFRGFPVFPVYNDKVDSNAVDLMAPTRTSECGDRAIVCNMCNFELPYRGREEADIDRDVRNQMHAHLYICHREYMWEARDIVRESWESNIK